MALVVVPLTVFDAAPAMVPPAAFFVPSMPFVAPAPAAKVPFCTRTPTAFLSTLPPAPGPRGCPAKLLNGRIALNGRPMIAFFQSFALLALLKRRWGGSAMRVSIGLAPIEGAGAGVGAPPVVAAATCNQRTTSTR